MASTDQESPMLPKRAEELEEIRKKLQEEFDKNPPSDKKEFKEKESFLLRLRRSISWLDGAQQVESGVKEKDKNLSAQFIFFWISFNALYVRNFDEFFDGNFRDGEKEFKKYFDDILIIEGVKTRIHKVFNDDILWEIHSLTKNIFVRSKFWRNYDKIKRFFQPNVLPKIPRIRQTRKILHRVFECLYVLRNQLMHGGSTWGSKLNKKQLRLGIKIMQCLLPIFMEIEERKNNLSNKKEFEENVSFLLCANSWLKRAQQVEGGLEGIDKDINTQFIFLWIGFNAIYAGDPHKNLSQREEIEEYFGNLLKCNEEAKDRVYNIIDSNTLKEKIESLRKDISVLRDFLNKEASRSVGKDIPFLGWNREFTENILCYIFQHFCVLRNQLVHGYDTWDCELKKKQLSDNTKIMHQILPVFIKIMLEIPEKEWTKWGKIKYPRVFGVGIEGEPYEETLRKTSC